MESVYSFTVRKKLQIRLTDRRKLISLDSFYGKLYKLLRLQWAISKNILEAWSVCNLLLIKLKKKNDYYYKIINRLKIKITIHIDNLLQYIAYNSTNKSDFPNILLLILNFPKFLHFLYITSIKLKPNGSNNNR